MANGQLIPSSKSEQTKRHSLLQALHRRGRTTRLRLAPRAEYQQLARVRFVENMLAQGLLRETLDASSERRGRKGVELGLNPKFGHLVGFDMEAKRSTW